MDKWEDPCPPHRWIEVDGIGTCRDCKEVRNFRELQEKAKIYDWGSFNTTSYVKGQGYE